MTKWQSTPLAAMSLWDYDDLQKSLEENPKDTRPKLLKRIFEFLTKYSENETDVDLVGETVILLNRVGAWAKITPDELAPILLKTNKKTRSVFFEELPEEIANPFATAMQKVSRAERAEANLRETARLARKANRQDIVVTGSRVIAAATSEKRRSASSMVLVNIVPDERYGTGGRNSTHMMLPKLGARAVDDQQTRHVETYDSKKRKKSTFSHHTKA